MVREILAIADVYFTDHEVELRARVAEVSRARFRGGMLPLDVYTEPRRRALEVREPGYLRASRLSDLIAHRLSLAHVGSRQAATRHPALIDPGPHQGAEVPALPA